MRYLLVLDMDLLAADEEFDLEPINYLVARQEQEKSAEVVVLSLVSTAQAKLPALELLLGAATSRGCGPRQSSRSRPGRTMTSMPRPSTA